MGEDRLLRWLRAEIDHDLIGDDAAVLPAMGPVAVTVDSQISGVHFVPDLDPALLARRLLAVNLSDLAATGAVPAYAFLALSTPPGFDHERFFRALLDACRRHGLRLAGGDLARSPQTTATLTLLGTRPEGGRWLHRSGAAPGHDLWVGGTLGESAAGRLLIERGARWRGARIVLPAACEENSSIAAAARRAVRRHLFPTPQLELGRWLGQQSEEAEGAEGAAMDISDGLARDLHRLCRESKAGAEVVASDLPLAPRFAVLCARIESDPLDLVLGGGEDYVLLFTLPAGVSPPEGFGCRRIGRITESREIRLRLGGVTRPLPDLGWDHLEQLEQKETPARRGRGARKRTR